MIWSHTNESNNKKENESDYEPLWGPSWYLVHQPFKKGDEGKSG